MINEDFVKFTVFFSNLFKFNKLWPVFAALFLALPATVSQANDLTSDVEGTALVGEVSLVLGKAYLERTEQQRRQIEAGTPVRVGDSISTSANGHVHIRFLDDGLVSVRPDSILEVVRYHYDAARPEQSTVKFNLVEGVTRSISGSAARSARQRFRLNTPIAAIGVRGTDFVVSASTETVRALVNEGIIVMAPFSDQCSADSLGPCQDNAIELTGESLQIVELNAATPSDPPAIHERNPGMLREQLQLVAAEESGTDSESDGDEKSEENEVYLETVNTFKVTADAQQQVASVEPEPVQEPVVDFTPEAPVAPDVLGDRQLVWGRWSWADGAGELERITMPATEADFGRDITIGSSDYGLFRDQDGGTARVDSGLGVVGFALSSAQAFYSSESGIVALHVSDGSLNIDFDQRTFTTALSLEHASTGLIDFNAMGRIYSGGYFYDRSADQNVIGAVSLDGREAGYFFDKQLETGGIQGLTLWDSK